MTQRARGVVEWRIATLVERRLLGELTVAEQAELAELYERERIGYAPADAVPENGSRD